jgi:hypothetical protein
VPEIANAVAVAQAAATAATASAGNAALSANNASTSASTAGSAASVATDQAILAGQFAQAPTGTPLPGGGDSAAASAQKANEIAVESRDLDVSDPVTADETVESGHLFTERQVVTNAEVKITIPPGIFASAEKKARWINYRLRSSAGTGSIKFLPQPGGTNLVAPSIVARGHANLRMQTPPAAPNTITFTVPAIVPAITAGEIIVAFHAGHNSSSVATGITLTTPGTTGLTWTTLIAYPATPGFQWYPQWFITRALLNSFAGATINLTFVEGSGTQVMGVDWWALEGTSGLTPIAGFDAVQGARTNTSIILPAVPAQSRLLAATAQIGPVSTAIWSTFSSNISMALSGDTLGAPQTPTTPAMTGAELRQNEAYANGDGLNNVAGDTTVSAAFISGSYKPSIAAIAYQPKSVIGGGTVILNKEADRDSLTVKNGLAELWFQNDGVTVDLRTSKP